MDAARVFGEVPEFVGVVESRREKYEEAVLGIRRGTSAVYW